MQSTILLFEEIRIMSIVSRNCGGNGAWMNNTLNSPAPTSETAKDTKNGSHVNSDVNILNASKNIKYKSIKYKIQYKNI